MKIKSHTTWLCLKNILNVNIRVLKSDIGRFDFSGNFGHPR